MVWTQGPEGRLAKSLIVLYSQVQAAFPANRDRSSDGTIASVLHHEQNPSSDHEPKNGVVRALDITKDLAHGLDSRKLAEQLVKDSRVKYVISNREIASGSGQSFPQGVWRAYDGPNPHDLHCHISVKDPPIGDIETPWVFTAAPGDTPLPVRPVLARGSTGAAVEQLQEFLFVDGNFGAGTEAAVKAFQKAHGIVPDGIVGPYTWREILNVVTPPTPTPDGWQTGITATEFGGPTDPNRSGYDSHAITNTEMGVALPFRFVGARPKVETRGPTGTAIGAIVDIGPWNTNDPYWEKNARPQAESGTDNTGRTTNLAGIDLTPAMARAVGISGKGKVDWRFVT
jgi:hypothetical protein